MTFEEDFPSFAYVPVCVHCGGYILELVDKHCLDKERVREALIKTMTARADGQAVIELVEFEKELGL